MSTSSPLTPSKPLGLEMIVYYGCPHCGRKTPLLAPTQPAMAQCDACGRQFPVAPVDERTVRFVKTMLANGHAAVDPDYV
ncbi:hypothetical protein [Desulfohalobium retbaense]|uniref:Uncharacterized protein n=1 Tax=Desulfohalobium retbaense (strain ATCC 49708 / DSM 5692 / JCM 16813 / HR100) TaxID=485915 RepID=C8X2A7_DESRD|nr:hypothetical protein [Desulfohalobium retbaense]ACV68430.1 conserved hypothetical protein [Desulfohalobium retbaense DSM 5692]